MKPENLVFKSEAPFVGIIVVWINPVNYYEEKFLLTKDWRKFKIRLPGGKYSREEGDNDLLDTARRELKEETGLEVKREDFDFVGKFVCPSDLGGVHEKFFYSTVIVQEKEPKISRGREVRTARWNTKEQIEKLIQRGQITAFHAQALKIFFKNRYK